MEYIECEYCGEQNRLPEKENNFVWYWNAGFIICLVLVLIFQKDTYEGLTAEEWFDEYNSAIYEAESRESETTVCIEDAIYSWEDIETTNDLEYMVSDIQSCL